MVFSYGEVAHFGGDDGVFERPLPLAGCASLRTAGGRACVGSLRSAAPSGRRFASRPLSLRSLSLRERSAPFEVPPDIG